MITAPEAALARFDERDFFGGLEMLCAEREEKAVRAVLNAAPMDAVAVAQAQREHQIWRDMRGLRAQAEEFARKRRAKEEKKPGS